VEYRSQTSGLTRGQELARWGSVRVRYHGPMPMYLSSHSDSGTGLGAIMLLHLFQRLKCGLWGKGTPPKALCEAAWIDAGYALDAPEEMPAGGVRAAQFAEDLEGAEQFTFQREAP